MTQPRWVRGIGAGYLLAVLGLGLLTVAAGWGLSGLGAWLTPAGQAFNAPRLALLGWLGVAVLVLAATRGVPNPHQWWMVAAVGAWLGSTALSMAIHGVLRDGRYWAVAAIGVGVAAAATLLVAIDVRRLLLAMGWLFGWGSVVIGATSVAFEWPVRLLSEERFARWLGMLGLEVDSFGALGGLTSGRVYAGLTCGLLLVYTVRTLRRGGYRWWMWLSSPALAITVLWSLSRTGLVIVVLGLLAAIAPWERIGIGWLMGAVFAVILTPLLASGWLASLKVGDDTVAWRFDLWQTYLGKPQLWSPFGIGPQPFSLDYADHAHQQFLEALATGGWLGVAGVVAFVILGAMAARSAANHDGRAAIAVLFGMAAIFQVDVVTFAAIYSVINNAFVIVVVVLVAASSTSPRDAVESSATSVAEQGVHGGA